VPIKDGRINSIIIKRITNTTREKIRVHKKYFLVFSVEA